MIPYLTPAEAERIAGDEGERRAHAWRATIAASDDRPMATARALADLAHFEAIEQHAAWVGGARVGYVRRDRRAAALAVLNTTADQAINRAIAGKLPEQKAIDLCQLRRWLARGLVVARAPERAAA